MTGGFSALPIPPAISRQEGNAKLHGRAQAWRLKFGHERRRMGEFPRETRPMLCIGKTPDTEYQLFGIRFCHDWTSSAPVGQADDVIQ
jgi:hypothetical protein